METSKAKNPYLHHLMLDVKNMRVKHVRKMFVLLREMSTELQLSDMEHRTDWVQFEEFNKGLRLLVVQHGLTLGEFATGYVLNVQGRQRGGALEPEIPEENEVTTKKEPAAKKEPSAKKEPAAKKEKPAANELPATKKRKAPEDNATSNKKNATGTATASRNKKK